MSERQPGWYWVRLHEHGQWIVGEWMPDNGGGIWLPFRHAPWEIDERPITRTPAPAGEVEAAKIRECIDFVRDEKRLTNWDSWRKYIAEGGGGSWPRDAFESVLDWVAETLTEALAAAATCAAQERRAGWQPIETAPVALDQDQPPVVVWNKHWQQPEIRKPDGDWWRKCIKDGFQKSPTHWMPVTPLPAAREDDA